MQTAGWFQWDSGIDESDSQSDGIIVSPDPDVWIEALSLSCATEKSSVVCVSPGPSKAWMPDAARSVVWGRSEGGCHRSVQMTRSLRTWDVVGVGQ